MGALSWVDVSTVSSGVTGMTTTLGITDGSLTTDGSYPYWTTLKNDAIDDLNEITENIPIIHL